MKANLVTLSHGGGVQTQTLVEMIVKGFIEKPDAVIYAETGDHPQYVHQQVDYCEQRLKAVGVPLLRVSNGNLHDSVYGGGAFRSHATIHASVKRPSGKETKASQRTVCLF